MSDKEEERENPSTEHLQKLSRRIGFRKGMFKVPDDIKRPFKTDIEEMFRGKGAQSTFDDLGERPVIVLNIHKAKTHLSRLVEQAAKGESFIIAKAGKPMAKVVPLGGYRRKARAQVRFSSGAGESAG